jgi:Family of unknown function (DUF6941)
VEIDAMLCDHVQVADNKLFVSGGGIMRAWVNPQPPHIIMVGVAAVVRVPYTATNQAHTLAITLVTEDGQPVSPFVPVGMPDPGPIRGEVSFNLGRPADLSPGDAQPYCLGANFNIGLKQLGGYRFEIAIDGVKVEEPSLLVAARPPAMGLIQPGGSLAS